MQLQNSWVLDGTRRNLRSKFKIFQFLQFSCFINFRCHHRKISKSIVHSRQTLSLTKNTKKSLGATSSVFLWFFKLQLLASQMRNNHDFTTWSKICNFPMSIYFMCHWATTLFLSLLTLPSSSYCTYVAKSLVLSWHKEMLRVKDHSRNKISSVLYVHLTDMKSLNIVRRICLVYCVYCYYVIMVMANTSTWINKWT